MIIRFIHVPKTGGVSILASIDNSISLLGKEEQKSWEIRGADGTYHSKASQGSVRVVEPKDMTNGEHVKESPIDFSFAFIRNPWDRFVSSYAYLKEKGGEEYEEKIKPFKTFKDFAIDGPIDSLHFLPQLHWIDSQVNFVGRLERINSHFDGLCKTLNLPLTQVQTLNETKHKPYWEYYDQESRDAVAQKYEDDIKHLGYSFSEYEHPART
tara:strand:+ start:121 stop:753 length:633 start_codon:yes stop_codon:yes gene_type:complete